MTFSADVRMRAARIVRIRRADDGDESVPAVVGDDDLAMIGLEVGKACPGAEGDRLRDSSSSGLGNQPLARWASPGRARWQSHQPPDSKPPQAGVHEVGVAQRVEIGDHHVDAGGAQQSQDPREVIAAIHLVDRIGYEQHRRSGSALLRRSIRHRAARPTAPQRRGPASCGMPTLRVEQEVVEHHEALRAERTTPSTWSKIAWLITAGRRHRRR